MYLMVCTVLVAVYNAIMEYMSDYLGPTINTVKMKVCTNFFIELLLIIVTLNYELLSLLMHLQSLDHKHKHCLKNK